MVEWIVSSSVLIAVLILLRFVLKGKISLRLQYALWAVVLVRLLVPVSFGDTSMSVGNLTQKAAESEPVQFVSALSETELPRMTYQAAYNEVAKEYADRGIQIEEMPLEEYAETVDYEIMNKMNGDLSIAEVVKIIWISGIALVGVWFLLSNLRLYLSLKKTRTLLSDSHALPVYLSDAIDTPCLFGLFHPAIYLTSEAIESEHTQRHAVEHELTHFHHKDNIWAILRSVCLAVHWFNPLVWCAAVLSRNDAELACDESTILRLGEDERAAYGRTLIHLTCEKRPALLNTATTMTGSGKSIKERIALIVKKPKMALYTLIAVVVIVAIVVGCTFTGAKKTNTPWNWAQNLTSEDISSVELWSDRGNVSLTDGEHADFVRILNALEKKDFTENGQLTGGTPTYGLTVQTSDGEYHISESIAPSGSLEMGYGDKQWWIDNDALTAFIRTLLEQSAIPTGQYASVEEYIVQQAEGEDTVSLMMWEIPSAELADEEYETMIVDRKLSFLENYGSLDGLHPNGTLEAWGYEWLIKPDTSEIDPEKIVLAGGQYTDEDGYICFTNGQIVVALHYPDGSYDILGEEPHGDGIDFFGYHNSTEESLYDWYVKKYNLDLPLYVEDWIDLVTVPEGGRLGNYPVHRFDGDGWYIYVPVDTWTTPVRNSAGNYEITSEYQTGSSIIISKSSDSDEQVLAGYLDMGYEITEAGAVRRDGVETDCVYIYPADGGGSHVVHTIWYDENITDYPYIAMEPDIMRLIAESFTVDAQPRTEYTNPVMIFKSDEITITAPEQYADLIKVDDVGSDNLFAIAANLYYMPEYTANDLYAPVTNGGWMMSVLTTNYTYASSLYSHQESAWTVHRWTRDGRWVYAEHRALPGEYKCSNENLAEFQAVMESIEVSYEGLVPFDGERAIAQMNAGSPVDNMPFTNRPISWDTPLNGMFERTYETQLSMLGNIDQTTPPFFKSQTFEFDTCTVLLGTSLDLETTTHVGTIYILFHNGALGKLPLPLNANGIAMLPPSVVDTGNNTMTYFINTGSSTYHYTVDLVAQTVSMTIS